MSDESIAAVISSVASMIGAFAWPLVIVFLILRFRTPLGRLLESITRGVQERFESGGGGEASFSFAGLAVSGRIDAASALVATATQQPGVSGGRVTTDEARQVLNKAIPDDAAATRLQGSTVLWVDDNPRNNTFVVDALEKLGIAVTLVVSSPQALDLLEINAFDAVISDMGREEPDGFHDQAGYELLSELRKRDTKTPFFVYSGSNLPEHKAMARERGARGSTNRPAELISMVTSALVRRDERMA